MYNQADESGTHRSGGVTIMGRTFIRLRAGKTVYVEKTLGEAAGYILVRGMDGKTYVLRDGTAYECVETGSVHRTAKRTLRISPVGQYVIRRTTL